MKFPSLGITARRLYTRVVEAIESLKNNATLANITRTIMENIENSHFSWMHESEIKFMIQFLLMKGIKLRQLTFVDGKYALVPKANLLKTTGVKRKLDKHGKRTHNKQGQGVKCVVSNRRNFFLNYRIEDEEGMDGDDEDEEEEENEEEQASQNGSIERKFRENCVPLRQISSLCFFPATASVKNMSTARNSRTPVASASSRVSKLSRKGVLKKSAEHSHSSTSPSSSSRRNLSKSSRLAKT